jgi:hypothetical protein
MIILRLEKALSYDDPGWHDLKQQAMRINDSHYRLQTRSGMSGPIETDSRGATSARAYISGATPMRSRAASPFTVCWSHATMT